jgi:hypothetical protein
VTTEPHLRQLPDQLRLLGDRVPADVLELVETEHAGWRSLHDRLVALIASLLDVAAQDRRLADVIDQLIDTATVELDELVSTAPDAAEIAALLRAHGSVGSVERTDEATVFTHECGSGLRYWKDNPDVLTIAEGEVDGVPGGRPRYCARCIRSIGRHSSTWRVDPPAHPGQSCVWSVANHPDVEE